MRHAEQALLDIGGAFIMPPGIVRREEEIMTVNDFLQENPVKPIRLYKPEAKDWFGETKRYLHRISDGERRTDLLRRRVELLDAVTDPDEELSAYRDELHKKLEKAEQDMKRVTVEILELIGQLPSANQQLVITRKYVDQKSWRDIAEELNLPVRVVQMLHGRALLKLKRILIERGLIPDTYVEAGSKRDLSEAEQGSERDQSGIEAGEKNNEYNDAPAAQPEKVRAK